MHEGGTQVIHINFNSAQVDEVYFPQLEIVGDIKTTLPICVLKNGIQVLSTKFCIDLNNFLRLAPAPINTNGATHQI
jgi:hypothetical protein